MDNLEKLATQGTQDEDKQKKNTICVGHYYTQTNTNKTDFSQNTCLTHPIILKFLYQAMRVNSHVFAWYGYHFVAISTILRLDLEFIKHSTMSSTPYWKKKKKIWNCSDCVVFCFYHIIIHIAWYFVDCCLSFCPFFLPLCCPPFFDLQILITPWNLLTLHVVYK